MTASKTEPKRVALPVARARAPSRRSRELAASITRPAGRKSPRAASTAAPALPRTPPSVSMLGVTPTAASAPTMGSVSQRGAERGSRRAMLRPVSGWGSAAGQVPVVIQHLPAHLIPSVGGGAAGARTAHLLAEGGVGEQAVHRHGQRFGVPGRDEHPFHAVLHNVREAADVGGDDRR